MSQMTSQKASRGKRTFSLWFDRVFQHGVITDQIKEMDHDDLMEYCGQLYRRLDRIQAVIKRAEESVIWDYDNMHTGTPTLESVIYACKNHAHTEFIERNVGYERQREEYLEDYE